MVDRTATITVERMTTLAPSLGPTSASDEIIMAVLEAVVSSIAPKLIDERFMVVRTSRPHNRGYSVRVGHYNKQFIDVYYTTEDHGSIFLYIKEGNTRHSVPFMLPLSNPDFCEELEKLIVYVANEFDKNKYGAGCPQAIIDGMKFMENTGSTGVTGTTGNVGSTGSIGDVNWCADIAKPNYKVKGSTIKPIPRFINFVRKSFNRTR